MANWTTVFSKVELEKALKEAKEKLGQTTYPAYQKNLRLQIIEIENAIKKAEK